MSDTTSDSSPIPAELGDLAPALDRLTSMLDNLEAFRYKDKVFMTYPAWRQKLNDDLDRLAEL